MSEADFAHLFVEHVDTLFSVVFGFASITSGFLAAAYLAAQSIQTSLVRVLICFYSVIDLALIGASQRLVATLVGIRTRLVMENADWHPVVTEPQSIFPIMGNAIVVAMAAIYVAPLWYFFHVRNMSDSESAA